MLSFVAVEGMRRGSENRCLTALSTSTAVTMNAPSLFSATKRTLSPTFTLIEHCRILHLEHHRHGRHVEGRDRSVSDRQFPRILIDFADLAFRKGGVVWRMRFCTCVRGGDRSYEEENAGHSQELRL